MGISKHQALRIRVIDRELTRKGHIKTAQIVEILKEEFDIIASQRMIQHDLNAMQYDPVLGYDAPLENDKRKKTWHYTDPSFTIQKFGLREDEIIALKLYAETLGIYQDTGMFQLFSSAITKVIQGVKIPQSLGPSKISARSIQVDAPVSWQGVEYIPGILKAIEGRLELHILYKKFQDDSEGQWRWIRPYILKESRDRWYIVAKEPDESPKSFALDRLKEIRISETTFRPEEVDFEHYYANSVGISISSEDPIEITLKFSPTTAPYVRTRPIHSTQILLDSDPSGATFSVTVRPTYEVLEWILGFGGEVEVISPTSYRKKIKDSLMAAAKKYS